MHTLLLSTTLQAFQDQQLFISRRLFSPSLHHHLLEYLCIRAALAQDPICRIDSKDFMEKGQTLVMIHEINVHDLK